MNWLVDEQLPPELANWLVERGENALHTDQLPLNEDKDIAQWAASQDFIVITKDLDLVELHIRLDPSPALLYLSWPNMKKEDLLVHFAHHWKSVHKYFHEYTWIELSENGLHIHW